MLPAQADRSPSRLVRADMYQMEPGRTFADARIVAQGVVLGSERRVTVELFVHASDFYNTRRFANAVHSRQCLPGLPLSASSLGRAGCGAHGSQLRLRRRPWPCRAHGASSLGPCQPCVRPWWTGRVLVWRGARLPCLGCSCNLPRASPCLPAQMCWTPLTPGRGTAALPPACPPQWCTPAQTTRWATCSTPASLP